MASRTEIAQKYLEAQRTREAAAIDAVAAALAESAVLSTRRGNVEGKAAIVDRLRNPPQLGGGGGFGGGGMGGGVGMMGRLRIAFALLRRGRGGRMGGGGGTMGQAQFGAPVEEGNTVKMKADLPANPMGFAAITMTFTFDDANKIIRIEQQIG